LQQACFRVRGVPYNKRSAKTLAYVDSLVGVATEVDKSTLNKVDFVRLKIAARDVSRVPAILSFFEREVMLEEKNDSIVVSIQANKKDLEKFSSKA
jgi:hypothetical protein